MRSIQLFIIIPFTLLTIKAHASVTAIDSTKVPKGISVAYFGNLSDNHGAQVGLENYYLQTAKYKIIGTPTLMIQVKPKSAVTVGIMMNSTLRRTYDWGLFWEHTIKIGYMGSVYKFDFYKINDNNEIVNIGRKWNSSIMLGYAFGLGYDFSKRSNLPAQVFIKPNLFYRFPNFDNPFYLNNFSMEAGMSFQPSFLNK